MSKSLVVMANHVSLFFNCNVRSYLGNWEILLVHISYKFIGQMASIYRLQRIAFSPIFSIFSKYGINIMWQMTTFRAYKNPKGKTPDSANAMRGWMHCFSFWQNDTRNHPFNLIFFKMVVVTVCLSHSGYSIPAPNLPLPVQ